LERLGKAGRGNLGGTVYAGVGAGIVFAGGVCLLLADLPSASTDAWVAMGITALCVTIAVWRRIGGDQPKAAAPADNASPREIPEFWRFVFCQGALGLGYIIPATFLPVMAKQMIADPRLFGWAWPVFGAAAVASTLLAAQLSRVVGQRRLWIVGNLVMALGMLLPIVLPGLAGAAIAALCVGGTFMVITMVAFQEARRVGGAHARVLMAAMTSAFALGQIAGPLLVSGFAAVQGGFDNPLVAASSVLVLAAYMLTKGEANESHRSHATPAVDVAERGTTQGH
jgi:predicted MFS family arabinose efflux permease